MTHYLVDAANVIGSRPDGWWRDRAGAEERLLAAIVPVAHAGTDRYSVVLDRVGEDAERDGVAVLRARRRGRDAADDRIVEIVAAADPADLVVVTADRELRRRVTALGAAVTGPRTLLARLER